MAREAVVTNLTRQQWDDVCRRRISSLMFGGRVKAEVAIRHANETMVQDYGPRPEEDREESKAPKQGVKQWLLLKVAQRMVDSWRREGPMGKVLALLDGQKRLVVTLGFIISGLVAMLTGQDVGQWLDLALRAIGWTDAGLIESARAFATQLVPMLFALWAAIHALWKLWKERKAGATAVEMGSTGGAVKAAVASGDLVVTSNPTGTPTAVLELKGEPVVAKVHGLSVTA